MISHSSLGESQIPSLSLKSGLRLPECRSGLLKEKSCWFSACWAKSQTLSAVSWSKQNASGKSSHLYTIISSQSPCHPRVPTIPSTAWEEKQDMCRYRYRKLCLRALVVKLLWQLGFHLDRCLKRQLLAVMTLSVLTYKDGCSSWGFQFCSHLHW